MDPDGKLKMRRVYVRRNKEEWESNELAERERERVG